MLNATDLKGGITFLSNEQPCKVLKYSLIKMGRGGAIVRVNALNLVTGTIEDKTYSSNVKVEEASITKKKLQFLYSDGEKAVFVNPRTYEQEELPLKVIKDGLMYLKEGGEAEVIYWDNNALSVEVPPKADLKVTDTPPGVKGNSASNVFKEALLENGLKVKVPLFINNGDLIWVDTRSASYIQRAK